MNDYSISFAHNFLNFISAFAAAQNRKFLSQGPSIYYIQREGYLFFAILHMGAYDGCIWWGESRENTFLIFASTFAYL